MAAKKKAQPKKKRTLPKACEPFKFKPGQSGNPGGRPKRKPFTDAIIAELQNEPSLLRALVRAQLRKAKKGDRGAFKEIRDTVQGKPVQELIFEGGDEPVKFQDVSDVDRRIAELFQRAANRTAKT